MRGRGESARRAVDAKAGQLKTGRITAWSSRFPVSSRKLLSEQYFNTTPCPLSHLKVCTKVRTPTSFFNCTKAVVPLRSIQE